MEPPPSDVRFPSASSADEHGRVMRGGDLAAGTLLAAYRSGLFPMRLSTGELCWWAPDPRGILPLERLRVSRSLRRSRRRYEIRVSTAFAAVVTCCADRAAGEYVWITAEVLSAYLRLHELGWAHSVEAWTVPAAGAPAELAGGLYGVAIGGVFAGESMFSRRPDAAKVALVALVEMLRGGGTDAERRLIDVQWLTPHLASLGAIEIPRSEYLSRLGHALSLPPPQALVRRGSH